MRQGVPWKMAVPPEVKTEYLGVKLGKYYQNLDTLLHVQLASDELFATRWQLPRAGSVSASGGLSYLAAVCLGAELVFPEDHAPGIRGRLLKNLSGVDALKVPDPREVPLIRRIIHNYRTMQRRVEGQGISVNTGIGAQGPFTTAVILRGDGFFRDIVLAPARAHCLLEKCAVVNERLLKLKSELTGEEIQDVSLGDDYAGLISPDMYGEFVFPYLKRLYSLSDGNRHLHCETLKPSHLQYLSKLSLDSFDPGNNPDLSVAAIREHTDFFFTYNLFTVQDMKNGTPESIKKKYRSIVDARAPAVMTELCRGTPEENVLAFLEIARHYEFVSRST